MGDEQPRKQAEGQGCEAQGESAPPVAESLDSILSSMVGQLQNVREVLVDAIDNFPVLPFSQPNVAVEPATTPVVPVAPPRASETSD